MGCLKLNIENSTLLRLFNGGNWVVSKKDENLYRYGFQGSEKDDEVKGQGNSYTTLYRQLDPRIGRWLSIDPVTQPGQSPYCSMDNNPILNNDVLGNIVKPKDKEAKKSIEKSNNKLFGKIKNPFSTKDGSLVINEKKFDKIINKGTDEQISAAKKMKSLINDEKITTIEIGNYESTLIDTKDGLQSLITLGFGGVTITNPNADPSKDEVSFRIIVANDEWKGGYTTDQSSTYDPATKMTTYTTTKVPSKINVSNKENIVKMFHEIGHAYTNMKHPNKTSKEKNDLVEDFEKQIRKGVKSKAKLISHD